MKQVAILFAGTQGLLDDLEVSRFARVRGWITIRIWRRSAPAMLTDIATKKALDDDIKKRLTDAIKDYKANFLADLKDNEGEEETRRR